MNHDLRHPACTFDMVPDVTLDCLLSIGKTCNAGYLSVFDGDEVRIHDAETTKIFTSKPPVLKGWRNTISRLWKIPLVKQATIPNDSFTAKRGTATCPMMWTPKNYTYLFNPPQA